MTPTADDLDALAVAAHLRGPEFARMVGKLIEGVQQLRGDLARIAAGAAPITDTEGVVVGAELTLEAFDLLRTHARPTLSGG